MITIQEGQRDIQPLYLVHGIGGGLMWAYRNLAKHLNSAQPVHAFSSRGHAGLTEYSTPRDMAVAYVEEMRKHQRDGPYALGGYCFGGNVAYEMARVLEEEGEAVNLLLIIDAYPYYAERCQKGLQLHSWTEGGRFLANLYHKTVALGSLGNKDRWEHLQRMRRWVRVRMSRHPSTMDDEVATLTNVANYSSSHLAMYDDHVDGSYNSGSAVLMRTSAQPIFSCFQEDLGWSKLIGGGIEIIRFKGHHDALFLEPLVYETAKEVERLLAQRKPRVIRSISLTHRSPRAN